MDTTGQEEYDVLRKQSYPKTDVAFMCFSYDDKKSLEYLPTWAAEVSRYESKCLFIMVGMNPNCANRQVTFEMAEKVAKEIDAYTVRVAIITI